MSELRALAAVTVGLTVAVGDRAFAQGAAARLGADWAVPWLPAAPPLLCIHLLCLETEYDFSLIGIKARREECREESARGGARGAEQREGWVVWVVGGGCIPNQRRE